MQILAGKLLYFSASVGVSLFQAALVTLAIVTFSVLAMLAGAFLLAWAIPLLSSASSSPNTDADPISTLPDWMGQAQIWITMLGMPVSVFVSLLAKNSRLAMWFCVAAMAVAFFMVEVGALWLGSRGMLFHGGDFGGLVALFLILMLVQWLAFRGFLWAAGVQTLAPQWGAA
jgi:hypothetical protein